MLKNNTRHSIEFVYFSITFANGKWIAWFTMPADKDGGIMKEELDKLGGKL